jgi:hypothetical protein
VSPAIPAAGFVLHPEVLLPVLRKEQKLMRALLCHCHHTLEAEDDDALCAVVREHLIWRHLSLEPSEEQVQQIVATRAYNIEYAQEHTQEEEFAFEPY